MGPLVTVQTFSRVIDARLAQARLEGAGIRTFLLDESVASIDPFLINAIGGVKLQVAIEDEQAARDLLREPLGDSLVDDVDPGAPRCPRCDSEYVFGAGSGLGSMIGGAVEGRMKCKRCGHEGNADEFAPRSPERLGGRRAPSPGANGTHDRSADRPPVFRLVRRYGLHGGVMGFLAGFIATIFLGREVGVFGFAIGTLIGYAVGRSRTYAVCSDPTCRGPIRSGDRTCGRCGRALRGQITREGDHFVRLAEWRREQDRAAASDA